MRRRAMMAIGGGGGGSKILKNYLNIVALEDGLTFTMNINPCEYCIDGSGEWISLAVGTESEVVNKGQSIQIKSSNYVSATDGTAGITVSKKFYLEGNCMSLLFGDDAKGKMSLEGYDYAFAALFRYAPVVAISDDFLPATILSASCYRNMFREAPYLEKTPNLPATSVGTYGYYCMFQKCSSLVNAPSTLPATSVEEYGYAYMFDGCSSLVNAPTLPATSVGNSGYRAMFQNCSSLVNAPTLPATSVGEYGYRGMFQLCSSLEIAPEIAAITTRKTHCLSYMFAGCTKLRYIKAMFTFTPASGYSTNWVAEVASNGVFVKNSAATWNVTGVNGVPSGWTIEYADE